MFLADLGGIGVEDGDESKSLGVETVVRRQRPPEISRSDQQNIPDFVGPQNSPDLGDQIVDAIANARMTELAEIGQILSYLRIGEMEAVAQLFAGYGSTLLAFERLELAQIKTQPSNSRIGNGFVSRWIHFPPFERFLRRRWSR